MPQNVILAQSMLHKKEGHTALDLHEAIHVRKKKL